MKFSTDSFREVLDSILRNRSRSLLTGFGVFWGIFMLMLLSGGGGGLKELLQGNFEGFASNAGMVFAGTTSKPYKGFSKGRNWNLEYSDVDRLRSMMPELSTVTPTIAFWGRSVKFGDEVFAQGVLKGIRADYADVEAPKPYYGRFINASDVAQERKVCYIGKKVYTALFPGGGDPCGKRLEIDGTYYSIIGVDWKDEGGMIINGSATESVYIPLTQLRRAYNTGNVVQMVCVVAMDGYAMSELTPRLREIISRNHYIDPTDEQSMFVLNTQMIFGIVDNLFKGINFLIWLIGIGTLLAGVVGVSNIMMVAVKERTVEIGIRRAIGATPGQILGQILQESVILTLSSGLMGIVVSVGILSVVELAMTTDGILKAAFQVPFGVAVLAALLLTVLGVAAGAMPAARAMKIKPVDAMRDE